MSKRKNELNGSESQKAYEILNCTMKERNAN